MQHTEYMAQLRNRDPLLLDELFRSTNPQLFRVLASNGVFGEVSEDLVHQTWERFFTNLEKFEGRSTVQTFLCGILLNKIREHRRANSRIVFEEDTELMMDQNFTPEGWWKNKAPDPSALLENTQLAGLIDKCLEGLTALQKSAFLLKEVEQEAPEDICNFLGVSISNLRVLIFRAKGKLRLCLEGAATEESR